LQPKKQVQNKKSIAESLVNLLQSAWYKRGLLSFFISTLLWPLSQVYRFLAFVHRKLYQIGVLKVNKVSVPIVVIGNIVVGGGGKTPTVIALAQHLQAQGIRFGVISRGYGRTSTACIEVKADSMVSDVGDEPASIRLALDLMTLNSGEVSSPVFVANKRFDAATALLKTHPTTQVIISDDGLQHHALHHDIAIIVFGDRGLGNGLLLPAGPLRELAVKATNSLVLHTGNQAVKLPNVTAPQFTARRALASYAIKSDEGKVALDDLKQTKLVAVAGIANPEAFFDMLRGKSLQLAKTIPLPDHYDFRYGFNRYMESNYAGYTIQ
jgi:tetraacyldisaccharide 4'-kinase